MKIANLEDDISTYIEKVYLRRSIMSKEQVINYVMNSPANTNKAVLEGMLDGIGGGGTSEVAVYHFKSDEDNPTSELVAFIQENENKQVAVLDDEYGYMQTVVGCIPYIIATLSYDGEDLRLYKYMPDSEYPDIVSRGDIAITQ